MKILKIQMINLPLSPIENKSLFVMSDMLLDADVTAALKKIFGHKLFSHNLPSFLQTQTTY